MRRLLAWVTEPLCRFCRQTLDECAGDWPVHGG